MISQTPLNLKIAFISTYPPRHCGIATYTKDLTNSINKLNPHRLVEIIALDNPISEKLTYPWEVSKRIRQNEWEDYEKVLDYLNPSIIDIIVIQHEFGIFGGKNGEYIISFVEKLKKPFIITFHTILENPTPKMKQITQVLSDKASVVVVMLPAGAEILQKVYSVPQEKIVSITHGTPDFPFFGRNKIKEEMGVDDQIIMSSINLLSRGKGIEYAIKALPEIVKNYPNFIYYIIGQTHPVVLEHEGERYRTKLKRLVKKLKLRRNVRFINRYVSLETLTKYLRISDFYITPYENLEQIASGSLAYAIASGTLCISTPYKYAKELLTGRRGYFIKPKNSKSITETILNGLQSPKEMKSRRIKSYYLGRTMTWDRAAFRHIRVMDHLLKQTTRSTLFPEPKLNHLHRLTTNVGIIEHTKENDLDFKEGYSSDDNARALIVALTFQDKKLTEIYLDYLIRSEKMGKIFCDSNEKGEMVGEPGLGQWFGRTFWATSFAFRFGQTDKIRLKAKNLLVKLLPEINKINDVRTLAFILLGLCQLKNSRWKEYDKDREELLNHSLKTILDEYKKNRNPEWHWIENSLRYDNCRIPFALLKTAESFNKTEIRDLGLEMLDFIIDNTFEILPNRFRFIGCWGWMPKGGKKALFDEQPIEAGSTVQACHAAYIATGINYYKQMAYKAFAWFHGDNSLRRPLVNLDRHSIYDGITEKGLNMNQGAECIVEYLLSYCCYTDLSDKDNTKYKEFVNL